MLLVTVSAELGVLQPAASFEAEEYEGNKPTGSEGDSSDSVNKPMVSTTGEELEVPLAHTGEELQVPLENLNC